MTRNECFEFTEWVALNYRIYSPGMWIPKNGRITLQTKPLTTKELFKIWLQA